MVRPVTIRRMGGEISVCSRISVCVCSLRMSKALLQVEADKEAEQVLRKYYDTADYVSVLGTFSTFAYF